MTEIPWQFVFGVFALGALFGWLTRLCMLLQWRAGLRVSEAIMERVP